MNKSSSLPISLPRRPAQEGTIKKHRPPRSTCLLRSCLLSFHGLLLAPSPPTFPVLALKVSTAAESTASPPLCCSCVDFGAGWWSLLRLTIFPTIASQEEPTREGEGWGATTELRPCARQQLPPEVRRVRCKVRPSFYGHEGAAAASRSALPSPLRVRRAGFIF